MTIGKYIKAQRNNLLALAAIFALAACLRLVFIFSTDNFSGIIPAQRVYYAQRLSFSPADYRILDPVIPPFFPYLLKLWMKIVPGALSPRFLSFVFGVLTLLPFYGVVRLVKNSKCGLLAAFFLAVSPLHIVYSGLSMEEAAFYFLIFSALYLFLRYQFVAPRVPGLILCAFLVSVSFGFRFEGALYALVLSLFLLAGKEKKAALVFSALALAIPVAWGMLCAAKFANPFFSYTWQVYFSRLSSPDGCGFWCGLEKITRVFSLPFLLFGMAGFLVSLKEAKMRLINLLFLLFGLFFSVKVTGHTLPWDPKYFLTFGMFLIIYIASGISYFSEDITGKRKRRVFVAIFCVYAALFGCRYVTGRDNLQASFSLPDEIRSIAGLVSGLGPRDKVLVDVDYLDRYPENIIVLSSSPVSGFEITEQISVFGQAIRDQIYLREYRQGLLNRISAGDFSWIIYAPRGRSLQEIRPFLLREEAFGKARYKRILMGEIYWVYKLEK